MSALENKGALTCTRAMVPAVASGLPPAGQDMRRRVTGRFCCVTQDVPSGLVRFAQVRAPFFPEQISAPPTQQEPRLNTGSHLDPSTAKNFEVAFCDFHLFVTEPTPEPDNEDDGVDLDSADAPLDTTTGASTMVRQPLRR